MSLAFSVAFTIGALLTFALVHVVGTAVVQPLLDPRWRVVVAVVGLGLLVLVDLVALWKRDYCPLTLRRQTPEHLAREYDPVVVVSVWGFDTGTLVTTFRVCAASWGALLLVLLGWASPWIALAYAAGFVVPLMTLLWSGWVFSRDGQGVSAARLMALLDGSRRAQVISGGLLALGAVLAATGALG